MFLLKLTKTRFALELSRNVIKHSMHNWGGNCTISSFLHFCIILISFFHSERLTKSIEVGELIHWALSGNCPSVSLLCHNILNVNWLRSNTMQWIFTANSIQEECKIWCRRIFSFGNATSVIRGSWMKIYKTALRPLSSKSSSICSYS